MSQAELAQALGVGRSAVSNWLAERNEPSTQMLARIIDALGITPAYFWGVSIPERPGDAA